MPTPSLHGRVHAIHVSDGGVPKLPVPDAEVRALGLVGDRQGDLRHHGGPARAVCLLAREVIARLQAEGHPIAPGSTGENLTLEGLAWERLGPGWRLHFAGGVALEVTGHAVPCRTIAGSFLGGEHARLSHRTAPGSSRLYARVVEPGWLACGEQLTATPPEPGATPGTEA